MAMDSAYSSGTFPQAFFKVTRSPSGCAPNITSHRVAGRISPYRVTARIFGQALSWTGNRIRLSAQAVLSPFCVHLPLELPGSGFNRSRGHIAQAEKEEGDAL